MLWYVIVLLDNFPRRSSTILQGPISYIWRFSSTFLQEFYDEDVFLSMKKNKRMHLQSETAICILSLTNRTDFDSDMNSVNTKYEK